MTNKDVSQYFDATEFRETRDNLIYAVGLLGEPKIAIDCGCGAGADIDFLIRNGYLVHGFDVDEEAISRCRARFSANDKVVLSQSSFVNFEYPRASLVVADASLFFCPAANFENVWSEIYGCLPRDGVFCGSFLGKEDTTAKPGDNPAALWPEVTSFEEWEVLELFKKFKLLRFRTHKSRGKTPLGVFHEWHIFEVVAQKL